ncbi:glycoside hydrolase family 3 C-terminal domain-containing protein [Herbiconiux moechotypicola]|uniref:Glycoside hydrolase family 3 C-terminal domain-containing protein n=1 Tax=Herbiconiux moechotypicola TaxID=637393 RepID=A0ABP5R231_9MICO|nr:glycoside hydrolase family 3 C-terminal domain-containing protein [Herbiconiux moechotypicola]MCS5731769.1 glycoside hydrolase family 3 C-terminal domain-containing protein [Herbiconiux moechotypicola]
MTPTELLALLTDEEKVALTAGADAWTTPAIDRLGIPPLRLGDGPHGVRRPQEGSGLSMFDSHPATCFPTAAALGASWDPALVRRIGEALGRESQEHGVDILLGPGVNLKRTPIGGRNFEYYSEDPLVSSTLGSAWVGGVQSAGIGASVKHFAANNTEQRRYGIDSVVDERALRELYLSSFEPVVTRERPATVMAAYNRLNGTHCTENHWLLTEVLREEWGYEGVVVSDWGASWDRTASIPAGTDLTMPGLGRADDRYVLAALRGGGLSREALDAAVLRVLELVERYGGDEELDRPVDLVAHHLLAKEAAEAGTVLLKNDALPGHGVVLPMAPDARVAVIGAMAAEPRFQGAGSSHVVPTRVESLLESLREREAGGLRVDYAEGYDRYATTTSAEQLAAAVRVAGEADVAVVVIGLPEVYETEGVDRRHMRLPECFDALVDAVAAVNPRTVVVLQNGSPVELPWVASVPAVLECYLGGQASGSALASVLVGESEPGGRLAETFPVRYEEHPVSWLPAGPATVEYRESLYLGYRYFDTAAETVAFPFGHGLSYTDFSWTEAVVTGTPETGVVVRLTVTNTGDREGCEVVQVYVHDVVSTLFRPEQELRGFGKVRLTAGESREVEIVLPPRAFAFWDVVNGAWVVEPGRFEVRLARSSRDVVQRVVLTAAGEEPATSGGEGRAREVGPVAEGYRRPGRDRGFGAAAFTALLGRGAPANRSDRPGAFTLDTALRDMQGTRTGRWLTRFLTRQAVKTIGAPDLGPVDYVAGEVVGQFSLRMLPTVSDAVVSRRTAVLALRVLNRLTRPRGARGTRGQGTGESI